MALEDDLVEIKQLLQEVRDLQRDYHQAWLERQKEADKAMRRARRTGWVWIAVFVLILLGVYYVLPYLSLAFPGSSSRDSYLTQMRHFEAVSWLENNQNESALASNRFGFTTEALEFVRMLYENGATGVYVTDVRDEPSRIEAEKGPYADSLIVVLPEDRSRRAEIFAIYRSEAAREGFTPEFDHGQKELFFWWD